MDGSNTFVFLGILIGLVLVGVGTSRIRGTKDDLIRDLDGLLEGDEKKAADEAIGAISLQDKDTLDRLAAMQRAQADVNGSLIGGRRAGHAVEAPKRSCWWCGTRGKNFKPAKPKHKPIKRLSTWNHDDNEVSNEVVQRNNVGLYKIMAVQRKPLDAQAGIDRRGLSSWMYKTKNQYGWWFGDGGKFIDGAQDDDGPIIDNSGNILSR
ncbi:uncharacterized protein LOC128232715 [Mya arenaria]|uniref:uncharacterized protein LOC128232715 n=1 Tax=Mya arenaria TaxID=6604 RepID=UPI0022DF5079|nr:uncharacterized protein LOC128232715 [Mya arenaria]